MSEDREQEIREKVAKMKELSADKYQGFAIEIQQLFADIQTLVQAVEDKEKQLSMLQKELSDTRWFLGEEKSKAKQLDEELQRTAIQIKENDAYILRLEKEKEAFKRQWEESEWFLGETKATRQQFEDQLQSYLQRIQQLEADKEDFRRRWEESEWYLKEIRSKVNWP